MIDSTTNKKEKSLFTKCVLSILSVILISGIAPLMLLVFKQLPQPLDIYIGAGIYLIFMMIPVVLLIAFVIFPVVLFMKDASR